MLGNADSPPPPPPSGLSCLTNQVKGVSYGAAKRWQPSLRRKFGVFLLYRAMKVLVADGVREIHPGDL